MPKSGGVFSALQSGPSGSLGKGSSSASPSLNLPGMHISQGVWGKRFKNPAGQRSAATSEAIATVTAPEFLVFPAAQDSQLELFLETLAFFTASLAQSCGPLPPLSGFLYHESGEPQPRA